MGGQLGVTRIYTSEGENGEEGKFGLKTEGRQGFHGCFLTPHAY